MDPTRKHYTKVNLTYGERAAEHEHETNKPFIPEVAFGEGSCCV